VRLPVTEDAARDTLLLPMYATMTSIEQEYVVKHLLQALKASRPGAQHSQIA
jgi:dTDP-4-amino-4,6-dideoxygalactose transaminase